jgi:DNA-binding MarR family transcriptional regulator
MHKTTGDLLANALQQFDAHYKKAETGVSGRQRLVLAAAKEHPGATQTRLVSVTGIDRSTISDIIRRLMKRRLLNRRRKTNEDARAYSVNITEEGLQALERSEAAVQAGEAFLRSNLTKAELSQLRDLLEKGFYTENDAEDE